MDKLFKQHETSMRKVASDEKILQSAKRVKTFKGAELAKILKLRGLKSEDIKEMFTYMLINSIILKVQINAKNKKKCDLLLDYRFSEADYYIWSEEKLNRLSIFICLGIILLGLCLVMFQMWPSNLKYLASYFSYLCGGFIAFMLILGVLRLIIVGITYFTHPPGIWLFPNLFADCGFIDSFIPLWCYRGDNVKKEKNE